MKKLKTYVLMLAHSFPAHHYKKGDATQFHGKCLAGVKIHTIRINAKNWARKIDEVNAGHAIISVRQWSGKPYEKGSSQPELFQMTKCGYEYVRKNNYGFIVENPYENRIEMVSYEDISKNDGLTMDEFTWWFKKIDTKESLIIIHFTDFRYSLNDNCADVAYLTHTYQSN